MVKFSGENPRLGCEAVRGKAIREHSKAAIHFVFSPCMEYCELRGVGAGL